MTTTLFVDFGRGIGMGNTLSTTVENFRDIFGAGTGTNLTTQNRLNATSSLDFTPLNYNFDRDLNNVIDNNDIDALANAVVPIMQRALEPFDIDVVVAAAANLADALTTVNGNAGDTTGQFDSYVFVTAVTSNQFTNPNNVVGTQLGLNGEAAGLDIGTNGNTRDEAALTFADLIFSITSGTQGTTAFNENLAFRLAFTTTHEAFHTFSYIHTPDEAPSTPPDPPVPQASPDQRLLTSGEVIRRGSVTRENPFIVTRFDLSTNGVAAQQNSYRLAANDPDIGLRDTNRNGRPDLAYVTGTGAFDRIQFTNAGTGIVNVNVDAFNNQVRQTANRIAQSAYPINLATDTEGGILVDSSINSDEVIVDARVGANFRLRGGTGTDASTDPSASESDRLTLQSNGLIGTYTPGTDLTLGTVNYAGGAQIVFSEFEEVEADNIPITVSPLRLDSSSIQEGNTLVLNGSFINIDTGIHTVIIDWGDGSASTLLTLGSKQRAFNNVSHRYVDDNPTGTSIDNYTITVTVTDRGGDSGTTQSTIAVANVAPTITGLPLNPATIDENGTVTLTGTFTDPGLPDTHTVTVNWGDGTTSTLPINQNQLSRTFQLSHQYLDDNPTGTPFDSLPITVTVTDDDGGSTQASTAIRVNNIAPVVTGLALSASSINENDTITLSGTFTDPGTLDTHTVIINWGGGTISTLPVNQLNQANRAFQLSHQYLDDTPTGTPSDLLPITVTVLDDDSGSAQASTAIRVNNVNPVITSFTSNANFADRARAGKPININSTFTDIGTLDTHRAFVDWGDGTPTQEVTVLQGNGSGAVQGNHVYAKGGAYTMKLTLNDDDTGTDARFTTAIVIGTGGGPG